MIPKGRVIGVDLGSRRIGVAITDSDQILATGVEAIGRSGDTSADHRSLAGRVEDYGAVGVVVGLPVSMSGSSGPAADAVLREVAELRSVLAVEVETVDERLTTVAASRALRASGRRTRDQRAVIDQTAAAVLLQTWADRRRSAAGAGF
jgi:putative Holliday junction resolvase